MKKLIQYSFINNHFDFKGTNQLGDFFISALCVPFRGVHLGCYLAAVKVYDEIKHDIILDKPITGQGYSMGGGFAQAMAVICTRKGLSIGRLDLQGSYPAISLFRHYWFTGQAEEYGNDIVTKLGGLYEKALVSEDYKVKVGPTDFSANAVVRWKRDGNVIITDPKNKTALSVPFKIPDYSKQAPWMDIAQVYRG